MAVQPARSTCTKRQPATGTHTYRQTTALLIQVSRQQQPSRIMDGKQPQRTEGQPQRMVNGQQTAETNGQQLRITGE